MKRISKEIKLTIQVILAVILVLSGISLLFIGLYSPPPGEIHDSILVAFGEACSFAGALMGIDYTYRFKMYKVDMEDRMRKREENNIEEE